MIPTKKATKKRLTVYPDPMATSILGSASPVLNAAIECWAQLMKQSSQAMADHFSPEEWAVIAAASDGMSLDPSYPDPGPQLARRLADHWAASGRRPGILPTLVERLRQLAYAEAWYVAWAIFNHRQHPKLARWWKLPFGNA